jgi:hypothetical protein
MNKRNESELNRARGVIVFRTDHPLTPEIPRVTALTTSITTLIGKAESDGGNQVEGQGDFLGGSAHRRQLALALQSRLVKSAAPHVRSRRISILARESNSASAPACVTSN